MASLSFYPTAKPISKEQHVRVVMRKQKTARFSAY